MKSFYLIPLIFFAGGTLSFALTRIALRLQQQPGRAAVAGVLTLWQMIALGIGRAPLASAVMLLILGSAILMLSQWLHREGVLTARARRGLYALGAAAWAMAASFPALTPDQTLAFACAFIAAITGAWLATHTARNPVALGKLWLLPPGLWLLIRGVASCIAAG